MERVTTLPEAETRSRAPRTVRACINILTMLHYASSVYLVPSPRSLSHSSPFTSPPTPRGRVMNRSRDRGVTTFGAPERDVIHGVPNFALPTKSKIVRLPKEPLFSRDDLCARSRQVF